MKFYIGIDNGITGSIGVLTDRGIEKELIKTPIFKQQDYTKKNKKISRLDHYYFNNFIEQWKEKGEVIIGIEKPFKNPISFDASISACRCFEAMLISFEQLLVKYSILNSRQWQKIHLPNIKGKENLKKESKEKGLKIFKKIKNWKGDFDALFIAKYIYEERGE